MCGRFKIQYSWAEIHAALDGFIPSEAKGRNDPPRYNIAPTQDGCFIFEHDGERVVKDERWWLVPFWAKQIPKYPMFNAQSETAREKSSFREPFKSKRCIIPAGCYYEWTKANDGGKDPHHIHMPEQAPFCFAGLWAHNDNLDITSCMILTAEAAPKIAQLHHRMQIILKQSSYDE
jgi:putative SOS response-associated peptidase YedK